MSTQGKMINCPSHAVTCPWCGHKHDFREMLELNMCDDGAQIECADPKKVDGVPKVLGCGRIFEVVKVQPVTVITVRQSLQDAEIRAKRQRDRANPSPVQHRGAIIKRR